MSSLHPCPHCDRHHRAYERVCPFCGGELPACEAGPTPRSLGRMSRAMLVAAGAAALGGASCQSVPAPLYGIAVIPDSSAGGAGGAGGSDGRASEDGGGAGTGAGGVGQTDGGSDS
jgi:hypothetical protein